MTSPRIAALIVAAGVGARSGSATPKQFAMVAGTPVVAHSHAALAGHPRIERVLIAIGPGQEAALEAALGDVPPLTGGATIISQSACVYFVLRLETVEELWLVGVLIPHDKFLSGHSDADVALQANT